MKKFFFVLFAVSILCNIDLKAEKLFSWGRNDKGQLGDSSRTDNLSSVQIGIEENWLQVACGNNHTLAIKSDGTLWAWGWNYYGQLGDGTKINSTIPIQIGIETNWSKVACGSGHSIAINSNGTLWVWGWNGYGQLGDGTTTTRTIPVQIGSEANWSLVACGEMHSLAIKNDGTLWAWGRNMEGQLGDPNINSTSPVQIGSDRNWSLVACGEMHSIAIKSDGTLWAWGTNVNGELGDGTKIVKNIPVQIGSESNWTQVTCGISHNIALKNDGTLWAWGSNGFVGLGDSATDNRKSSIPIQISTETNWSQVFCGGNHNLAIKSDGSLWAWGYNRYGQLGVGTISDNYIPAQIGSGTNWSYIACGDDFSFGLMSSINNAEDSRAEIFNFKASPNPFFDEVNIEFNLPSFNKVCLQVYDISGAEVSTLFEGTLDEGNHKYTFDGTNLASGEYIVNLIIGNEKLIRKVIRVK